MAPLSTHRKEPKGCLTTLPSLVNLKVQTFDLLKYRTRVSPTLCAHILLHCGETHLRVGTLSTNREITVATWVSWRLFC